jgi:hypothetical protein
MKLVKQVLLAIFGLIAMSIGFFLLAIAVQLFSVAHAQRYDSSYGYEQRGFIPPDPFASRLFRERRPIAEPPRVQPTEQKKGRQR